VKRGLAVPPTVLIRHDPLGYGRALKQALWTREALALVPGRAGWGDDDGLLLADALCRVFGAAARLMVVTDGTYHANPQHFLVRVDCGRFHGAVLLDAAGASVAPILLHRWRYVEGVHGARLLPAGGDDIAGRRRNPSVAGRVAAFVRDNVTLPCGLLHVPRRVA
jgi:hypothetical protein